MELLADALLAAGAFGAAVYCGVLSMRLRRLQALEGGMGGAVAVLSAQVDEMTRALEKARSAASGQTADLREVAARGEAAAARLELILATLGDLPETPTAAPRPSRPRAAADPAPRRRVRVLRNRSGRDRDGVAA